MKTIISQLLDRLGINDAFARILILEEKVQHMEKEINGLKMEANILYAKTMTVEDVI